MTSHPKKAEYTFFIKDPELEKMIKAEKLDLDIKSSVLGHLQRGGSPTSQDRYLGTSMGVYAVNLLKQGIGNRIVGLKDNKIFDIDIVEGLAIPRKFNKELYEMAQIVAH